jgi:hypothetical protein
MGVPAVRAAREVIDGVVRHPLFGQVEFTSTDHGLAEKVAADLDERSPVTVACIIGMLKAVPLAQRDHLEWVMPLCVLNVIRRMGYIRAFWAAFSPAGPERLLGYPVVIDDSVEGLTVRTGQPCAF